MKLPASEKSEICVHQGDIALEDAVTEVITLEPPIDLTQFDDEADPKIRNFVRVCEQARREFEEGRFVPTGTYVKGDYWDRWLGLDPKEDVTF